MMRLVLFALVSAATAEEGWPPSGSAIPKPCTRRSCVGAPVHRGCVHDGARARMMNAANLTSRSSMTLDMCVAFCRGFSPPYKLAGVENQDQCFCGNDVLATAKPGPAFCATPGASAAAGCNASTPCRSSSELCCCAGNASQTCGATGLLDIYDISAVTCGTHKIAATYCDSTTPVAARVDSLIGAMLPEEKIGCLGTKTCQLGRLGVGINWKEALHGLRYDCVGDVKGRTSALCPTSFPHAQLLAASFNRSLWRAVGDAISDEARAWYNVYMSGDSPSLSGGPNDALSFFAPDINLCRDPRWGRCLEVPSECPLLTGEYAMGYVGGMQARDKSGRYRKTICNAKHWSSYDVERGIDASPGPRSFDPANGWPEGGEQYNRGSFNAVVSEQDLAETYWPQFRAAVRGADLGGTMCSYNAVCTKGLNDGVCTPSCANGAFNNDVLRGKFGFDGMIVSDCGAVGGIGQAQHNYTDPQHVAAAGLRGGTDLDCGGYYGGHVAQDLAAGRLEQADIDRALNRTITQMITLGLADEEVPAEWAGLGEADIDDVEKRRLAKHAAMQGFVLLKNEGLLPLKPRSPARKLKVAAIGPHFNSSTHLLANYYGGNDLVLSETPLLGLKRRPELEVVGGVAGVEMCGANCTPGDIPAAVALARKAEVAVIFAGLHSTQGQQDGEPGSMNGPGMEREGYDRTNLTLPGYQLDLVQAVHGAGVPTVVVLINSGGLAAEWVYDNIPAVLEAYYPGEMGGDAMASVLLGDVSPAGRLTTTIYPAGFAMQRNITDMEMRPHGAVPGVTYRFYPHEDALFSFGYGMSYTSFAFEWDSKTLPQIPKVMQSHSKPFAGQTEFHTTTAAVHASLPAYFAGQPMPALPTWRVKVTNVGKRPSDVVVMCFVSSARQGAPLRQLATFERVHNLLPGRDQNVLLTPSPTALTTVDAEGRESILAGTHAVSCGGEPDGWANGTLVVQGESVTIFEMPR